MQDLPSKTRNKIQALKTTGIFLVIAEVFDLGISAASFFIIYSALTDTNVELIDTLLRTLGIGYGPAMVVVGYILFAIFSLYLIKISFISNNFKIAGILGITTATLRIIQVIMVVINPKIIETEITLSSVAGLIDITFIIFLLLALMELSNQVNSNIPFLMGFLAVIFIVIKLPLGLLLMSYFSILINSSIRFLEDAYLLLLWFEIGYFFDLLRGATLLLLGVYLVNLAEEIHKALNATLAKKEVIEKLKNTNTNINQVELDALSRQLNLNKLELRLMMEELNLRGF